MTFMEPMPESIEQKFKEVMSDGERVRISVETDVAEDRTYASVWLIVTDRRVLRFSFDGTDGTAQIPLKDISSAKIDALIGGGCLQISQNGHTADFLYYSSAHADKFAEVARGIQQLAKGEELSISTEQERTRCERCGRLLPERDGICPACIRKIATLRRIAGYLAPYKVQTAAMVLISLLMTVIGLAPPLLVKRIIDDVLVPRGSFSLLIYLVLALLGLKVLTWITEILHWSLSVWLGGRMTVDIRRRLYGQLQRMSLRFYDKKQVGSLMSRVTNDTESMEEFLINGLPYIVNNTLMMVGILIFLFYMSWHLTLYVLLPVPCLIFGGWFFWRRLLKYFRKSWIRRAKFTAHVQETLSGIRVVKAFAQEPRELRRFHNRNDSLFNIDVTTERVWVLFFATMNFCTGAGLLLVWYVGGMDIIDEKFQLGSLVAFISYLWMLYDPLQWFGELNSWMTYAFSGAERVFEIIDSKPEPYNDPNARPMPNIEGRITFERASFGYVKSKPVLKEIDLNVEPGEMIGLVGKSGVGKTTMINLICRFYDVDGGSLKIDGVDVKDIKLEDLRKHIGMVLQEPFLFSGTISENISYSRPQATFEEIFQAARAANAHDFIVAKPDGYDTQVGERGGRLSGGEKQRISIARAILHDPRILILDEATSSVDTETEKQVQQAVRRLVEGRTTFAIAHRLSTLRYADRLVVLEDGKAVEVGSHEELIAQEGIFYRMIKTQQETSAVIAVGGGKDDPNKQTGERTQ